MDLRQQSELTKTLSNIAVTLRLILIVLCAIFGALTLHCGR